MATLTAVNRVHRLLPSPKGGQTAIDKRPVDGAVGVGPLGLEGDRQMDTAHHGGPRQALYAYAAEDAADWSAELGREVVPGLFGENLTTRGLDITHAMIGERWRVGEGEDAVVVEVSSPRVPCVTFQQRMGEPHWVRRFTERGATGAYLRVLQTGVVAAGMPVTIVHRPARGATVLEVFRAEPEAMAALLAAGRAGELDLDPEMRRHAERVLARRGSGDGPAR